MYHIPPAGHPDDEVFDVISGLLNGRTGRLFKSLIQDKGVAVNARGYGRSMAYAGAFSFSGEPKEEAGVTLEQLEQAIYGEIERLKNEPVEEYELQKVKNQAEARFVRGLRSTRRLAMRLGRSELYRGWRDIPDSLERMKRVTAEDIRRVAREYFTKENRTVGILEREERKGKLKRGPRRGRRGGENNEG
jgi:predicted Zn-dependent peptidase